MLADPQSVTINAVAKSLPLTNATDRSRRYRTSDGEFALDVKQDVSAKRFRREYRVTQTKVAADPLSAVNTEISASVYIVVDEPRWGFSDTELGYIIAGIKTAFDATAYGKVLGGEM